MSATPNIRGEKIFGSITGITLFSATTISGGTLYGDGSNLTGIAAPSTSVTGGTFSNGNLTLNNSTGGTIVISGSAPYNAGLITNATGWTDNNNGTLSLPQVNVALYNNSNFLEPLVIYTISSGTTGSGGIPNLFNEDTSYIVIEYNGGSPRYYVYDNDSIITDSDVVLFMITYRSGNFVHVLEFDNYGAGLPNKINDRILSTDRFARESGFSLGLSGSTGVVTLSAGVAWNGVYRQALPQLNSQDDIFFQSFHSGGTWVYTTTGNTLNNEYYDDGTNKVLATASKYLVNWYFRGQEINDHLYEVWGNDEYDSVAEAQLSVEPSLPELVTSHAFLLGRIIVQVSATTGSVESAFVSVFQSTQVTAHNDLNTIQGGSAGEYFHLTSNQYSNNAYTNVNNNFSVGQTINGGVTATTYYGSGANLSGLTDVFVTGGTYTNGNILFTNNTGGTFNVSGFTQGTLTGTGVTNYLAKWNGVNELMDSQILDDGVDITFGGNSAIFTADVFVSGDTTIGNDVIIYNGLSASTISATTYQNLPIDVFVTGGTYSNGSTTFTNNTGGTFNVVGFFTGYTNVVNSLTIGVGLSADTTIGDITIINTAPDQVVSLTSGTDINVTGTYPNFTIDNTAPDQIVTLSGGTGITTGGTYPNFTITNSLPDQVVTLTQGTNVTITGTYPNFTISASGGSSGTTMNLGLTYAIANSYQLI